MWNRVMSYSLRCCENITEMLLKCCEKYNGMLWKNYCENSVLEPKCIDIHFFGGYRGDNIAHLTFVVYYSQKTEKVQPILKFKILHHFESKKLFGWIIKILRTGAPGSPAPISLRSEYSSSNWFHRNSLNSRYLLNIHF